MAIRQVAEHERVVAQPLRFVIEQAGLHDEHDDEDRPGIDGGQRARQRAVVEAELMATLQDELAGKDQDCQAKDAGKHDA